MGCAVSWSGVWEIRTNQMCLLVCHFLFHVIAHVCRYFLGRRFGVITLILYSRASWQFDMPSMAEMLNSGDVTGDGYVNVAQHLGLSGERGTQYY